MKVKKQLLLISSIILIAGAALAEGYYVRADFGYSWSWEQDVNTTVVAPPPNVAWTEVSPEAVPLGQMGYGYFAAPYVRSDVTASMMGTREYDFVCSERPSTCIPGEKGSAKIDTSTLFVNVYYELASIWTLEDTWYHPYIGIGIGAAYHNAHHIGAHLPVKNYESYVSANADWEFAWRGTAGIAFNIYKGLLLDLAYIYMDAGEAEFGDKITFNFSEAPLAVSDPEEIEMKTQEAYIGLRYQF